MEKIQEKTLKSIQSRLNINPFGNKWILSKSFYYDLGSKDSGKRIKIDKGFPTDGASVPRIFWIFGSPMDIDTIIAAIVHDYLTKVQEIDGKPISRKKADEVFNEILLLTGVNAFKRRRYFIGVRIGGWKARNKNKKTRQKQK